MAHHDNRTASLGAWVLIIKRWYKWAGGGIALMRNRLN